MATTALAIPPIRQVERLLAAAGIAVTLAIVVASVRHALVAGPAPRIGSPWLLLHLSTIVPALPLGAFVLARAKGDALHRAAGRTWAALMIVAAVTSFGVVELTGRLSPIHLLSALTLVGVPRAIVNARRHRVLAHRRGMTIVYAGSVAAGLFVFLPQRLLGLWLFA